VEISSLMVKKVIVAAIVLVIGACVYFLRSSSPQGASDLHAIFGGVGYEYDMAKKHVADWSRSSGCSVKVSPAVRGTDNRLQQYLPHFQTPAIDLYQVDVIWGPMLADVMEDLRPHFSQEELNCFQPEVLAAGTVKGKLVFLPLYIQWLRLYVRKDLLDKYNLDIPKTWDDLENCSRVIMRGEASNRAKDSPLWGLVFLGQPYECMTCVALSMMASLPEGFNVFDEKGKLRLNSRGNIAAWERLHNWLAGEKPIVPKSTLAYVQETARQMFQRGDAVFMINWPYAEELMQADGSPVKDKFVVVELPAGCGKTPTPILGGACLAVSAYSQHKKEAIDLLRFMVSKESQQERAQKYRYVSGRRDVVRGGGAGDAESAIWQFAIARPAGRFKKWSAAGFTFGGALHKYLQSDQISAKEVLGSLQESFTEMLA